MHRAAQDRIAADVQRIIAAAWRLLDPQDLDATAQRWAATVLPLILAGRERSAATAATYLRAFASVEAGVQPRLVLPETTDELRAAVNTSLLVTGAVTIRALTASGYDLDHAANTAQSRTQGAAQRHVLNGGRDTVRASVAADPRGTGWVRVTSANACGFCLMLAGRDDTVYSAETADFGSHDNCDCSVEPVYGGDSRKVQPYTPSQRRAGMSDQQYEAHKARTRAYLRKNYPGNT